MEVDLKTFNNLIQKPIIYVLLRSTSSTKHASLWKEIKYQSDVIIINGEENKDLMSYLNIRILPVVLVYNNGNLDRMFTMKDVSRLKEYVINRTI